MSSCYLIMNPDDVSQWKTWAEARDHCTGMKADLAVLDGTEEQDIVDRHTYGDTSRSGYWLGLSGQNGTWGWVDGTEVTPYWTLSKKTSSSQCAVAWKREWEPSRCTASNRWICEKKCFMST